MIQAVLHPSAKHSNYPPEFKEAVLCGGLFFEDYTMATSPYDFALTKLGKGEVPDRGDLQKYLATGGANLDPKTTAWCAAFVNASLGQAGIKGTGSNLARSFLNWGEGVKEPTKGDLAVFSRGDPNGPYGHVGFFDSYTPDGKIKVLGGNQGDAVSYGTYDPGRLLGFRRQQAQTASLPDGPKGQEAVPPAPVMGSMAPTMTASAAPQAGGAAPPAVAAQAAQPAANPMASVFGAMMAQQDKGPQFSPVQIQGPSQDQSTALANFIKSLTGRMA